MDDLQQLLSANNRPAEGVPVVEEEWGVFNDPDFFEPKFAKGEVDENLRELILDRPLWTSPIPGPAKRYQQYFNDQRRDFGQLPTAGPVILRVQKIVREPWRTVTGAEYDAIDDGKAPSGR